MAERVRLLGFAAATDGPGLVAALNGVAGPHVRLFGSGRLAVLAQVEPGGLRLLQRGAAASLRRLAVVQRRLEVACQRGPFLPADPAHAVCLAASVASLLDGAAAAIEAALAGPGTRHQWDVVLRWDAPGVVAAARAEIAAQAADGGGGRVALAASVEAAIARARDARDKALRDVLAPSALAVQAAGGGPTEIGLTVLLPAGGEAALEAALMALPDDVAAGCSADLRGPLPPVSFAAVRIDAAAPAEVAAAWQTLALPDTVDAAVLRRHWRAVAARLHPDRGGETDGPMAEAGAAFRLLRDLLPPGPAAPCSLPALQGQAASRMRVRLEDAVLAP